MMHMHEHEMGVPEMRPYLHFTGGDALWFMEWAPSSNGAIAGACLGLLLLAMFERLLVAVRGVLEVDWSRRARHIYDAGEGSDCCDDLPTTVDNENESAKAKASMDSLQPSPSLDGSSDPRQSIRSIAFIPVHDVSRGIAFLFQSSIAYSLMLAVMTWNVAYILSVVIGLGIGETLFGRFRAISGTSHH